MKIVINTSYGGIMARSAALRRDPQFIEDVENGRFVGDFDAKYGVAEELKVVEIPDDATDMMVVNYDGTEGVIYVCNGKIHLIPYDAECFNRIIG